MRLRTWAARLKPTWQQGGVLGVFGVVFLTLAWPTLTGRTSSVVPSFQTATFPWAANPRGLSFMWPQSDAAESAFPWSVMAHRTWRSGELPLWDPHSLGGGLPWATDGVAATLYPGRAIPDALFLPWMAHEVFILLHLMLAGAGTYWLARRWGAGYVGATLAGIGWMTNAYVWSWAPLEMVTPFFAALPILLAATDRAVRAPTRAHVASAAALFALGMIAGNISYSVILATTCGLYVAGVLLARVIPRPADWRAVGLSAAAGAGMLALGLALAAAALLPTALNLSSISRQPYSFETLTTSLMVPWDAYAQIVQRPDSPPPTAQLLFMVYLTPVVVVLALVGLVLARGLGGWSARGIVLVPVLIASTVPGAWVAYHLFPGFDVIRPYGRLLPVALVGVYVLAGLGADRLWELVAGRLRRPLPAWVGPVLAAGLIASVFVPAHAVSRTLVPPEIKVADYPLYPGSRLVRQIKQQDSPTGWPLRVLPTVPTLDTDPPSTGALVLIGGTALVPGLDTWGGYASAIPARTDYLLRMVNGEDPDDVLGGVPGEEVAHPVFTSAAVGWALACRTGTDLLALPPVPPEVEIDWGSLDADGIRRVYSGPDGQVFRMPDGCATAPRVATEEQVVSSDAEAVAALEDQGEQVLDRPTAEVSHPVVVTDDVAEGVPTVDAAGTGEVESAERDGGSAVVRVTTDGPSWLVLPIAYDDGWTATMDGHDVDVERVDYNRVGIRLEAGTHTVELEFWPPGWTAGVTVSTAGLLALGVLLVVPRLRRRRAAGDRP